MNPLTSDLLNRFRENYESDRHAKTVSAALAKTELSDLAYLPANAAKLNGAFSVELKTRGITWQKRSGRCWAFSALNIMREIVAEKCNLEEFKLSGNYIAFFDKLEKANNVLEMVIENADKPLNDRMMQYILEGFHDGGYWDMVVNLVDKYGIVPDSAMPDTYQSTHTATFMRLLNTLVHKDAAELRKMIADGKDPTARKEEMMAEIFKAECIAFGEPPASFNFEYRDKDNNYYSERNITPKEFFAKYIGMSLNDYVTIRNEPTYRKKFNTLYQFHYIGNMAEGNVTYLNLSNKEMEDLCIKQLKDGEPIWFGCDCEAYESRTDGVWDPESFDFDGLLGNVDLFIEKTDRLEYRDSYANHAMIFVGVNFDENGNPDRWKIENSWGETAGKKGYFVCSEHYFQEYVYEVIINKKHLSEAQLKLFEQEPVIYKPWEE